jgi:hypothetical protein
MMFWFFCHVIDGSSVMTFWQHQKRRRLMFSERAASTNGLHTKENPQPWLSNWGLPSETIPSGGYTLLADQDPSAQPRA